jgi:hypothetical protein
MTGLREPVAEALSESVQVRKLWPDPQSAAAKSGSREWCVLIDGFMSRLWLMVEVAR